MIFKIACNDIFNAKFINQLIYLFDKSKLVIKKTTSKRP